MSLTASDIIRLLELAPHPEGGHFRETFRDTRTIDGGRAASTAIYFLLARGERSHWHRVDAAEIWHWYAGAPLRFISRRGVRTARSRRRPCCRRAPAGHRARASLAGGGTLGAWTLVGCTVAPGFQFSGFELAPKDLEPARLKRRSSGR